MVSRKPDSFFERKIKHSQSIERAVSNQVFDTGEGTIVKKYSKRPLQAIVLSFLSLLMGRPVFLDRRVRKQRDFEMKTVLKSSGFHAPSIIHEGRLFLEMEKVEVNIVIEWIDSQSKAETAGTQVGKFLFNLHQKNLALLDTNLDNFLTDGKALYTVDHEYGVTEASWLEKEIGILMMVACSLSLDPKYYKEFRAGFEKSYRSIRALENLVGAATGLFIFIFVRRELSSTVNIVKNIAR